MSRLALVLLASVSALTLTACPKRHCSDEAGQALIDCGFALQGEPDYAGCAASTGESPSFSDIDRLGYVVVACGSARLGKAARCVESRVDECPGALADISEECRADFVYSEACGEPCDRTLIACEQQCPTISFQACIDCSGSCRAAHAKCIRACKVDDLNVN